MISKEELEELYINQNMTQKAIGDIYGCDRKNIDYYLKKYKIPKRTKKEISKIKKIERVPKDEIIKRIEQGMLLKDIQEELGVSRSHLSNSLKEAGLNFKNHKNQTKKQSEFMSENNPFNDEKVKMKAMTNSRQTRYNNFINEISVFDKDMTFKEYSKKSRHMAYRRIGRVPKGMEIDHLFSIKDGYENQVPINVISDLYNLRVVTSEENRKKWHRSIITLDELYKGVGVQRLSRKGVVPSGTKHHANS